MTLKVNKKKNEYFFSVQTMFFLIRYCQIFPLSLYSRRSVSCTLFLLTNNFYTLERENKLKACKTLRKYLEYNIPMYNYYH